MLLGENSAIAGDAAKETNHRSPRPRSAARAMAGLLARGSTRDADLPGCPVIIGGVVLPLTVAGAATAFGLSACTVFPFDPRREPSRVDVSHCHLGCNRAVERAVPATHLLAATSASSDRRGVTALCGFPPFDEALRTQNFLTLTLAFPGPRDLRRLPKLDGSSRRDGLPAIVKLLFHSAFKLCRLAAHIVASPRPNEQLLTWARYAEARYLDTGLTMDGGAVGGEAPFKGLSNV